MANKIKALTSKLEWKSGTGGTAYVEILQVQDIKGPDVSISKAESTDLASTVETELPILPKHGPITCKGWWDPDDANHIQLAADARAGTKRAVKITNSDATPTTIEFATAVNFVESMSFGREKKGLLEWNFTISCNEAPTIA